MRGVFARVARDSRATAAIEFAIAGPVVILLLMGIAQMGLMLLAKSGLEQGVEAGARYATIYPTPSDAQIRAMVTKNIYGLDPAHLTAPSVKHGTADGVPFVEVSLQYDYALNLAFVSIGPVRLTHTRRAYRV